MCLQPSQLRVAPGNSALFFALFLFQGIFYITPLCAGNFQISVSLTAAISREEAADNVSIVRHAQFLY